MTTLTLTSKRGGFIPQLVILVAQSLLYAEKTKLCMTVDYYTLNSRTIPDRHPLLRINNILKVFRGACIFRKMDLFLGYHSSCVAKGHEHKMAFLSRWGLYKYTVTSLGLTNAPVTF